MNSMSRAQVMELLFNSPPAMVSVTCQVVDSNGNALSAISVTLHCRGGGFQTPVRFSSTTDDDGFASGWQACDAITLSAIDPWMYPFGHIVFHTNNHHLQHFGVVEASIALESQPCHHVLLRADTRRLSYSIEQTSLAYAAIASRRRGKVLDAPDSPLLLLFD